METILVAVDFSACGQNALKYAVQLAGYLNCRLRVLHVKSPQHNGGSTAQQLSDRLQTLYAAICANNNLPGLGEGILLKIVESYAIPSQIVLESVGCNATLIVMGTHGEGLTEQMLFGSNASNTIFKSDVPVLLVPERAGFVPVDALICATDMKDLASELTAIAPAARLLNTPVTVLHMGYKGKKQECLEVFKQNLNRVPVPYISFTFRENNYEAPLVAGLLKYASNKANKLLTLFPGKRSFFDKFLVSSTSEQMCYSSKLPFLVIRKSPSITKRYAKNKN